MSLSSGTFFLDMNVKVTDFEENEYLLFKKNFRKKDVKKNYCNRI